jgi:hypothetical protein
MRVYRRPEDALYYQMVIQAPFNPTQETRLVREATNVVWREVYVEVDNRCRG